MSDLPHMEIDSEKVSVDMPVVADELVVRNISEVLAHTEIIETPHGDLVASPGQMWLLPHREAQSVSWEITLTEEQFWMVVGAVYGPQVVAELKAGFDDLLRWEGEGGSCLN